jgi:hypothetical protein
MEEHVDRTSPETIAAECGCKPRCGELYDNPDELTKNNLDEVVGGAFQYYISVKGNKQNPKAVCDFSEGQARLLRRLRSGPDWQPFELSHKRVSPTPASG